MTVITAKGRELAYELAPYIGWTPGTLATCSAIARSARAYARIQERWCNEEMSEALVTRLTARESVLEERLASLAQDLPATDGGPWRMQFTGDPRGYTVRLVTSDGDEIGCDRG